MPIVVGGTGFYLRWYVHGKPSTPRSTKESAALAEQALERVNNLSSSQTKTSRIRSVCLTWVAVRQ